MNDTPLKILLVEDSPSDAELLREILYGPSPARFAITHVERLGDALSRLQQERFDVVLLDLSLPDSTGRDTILRARAAVPHLPIVVLTGSTDSPVGIEAVRQGVQDYLIKGETDARQVERAIRYAIARKRMEEELRQLNATLEQRVAERTAELHRTNAALRDEIARARQLEGEILNASEREQCRIGQDLHDGLGQLTTAAAMISEGLAHDLRTKSLPREARTARRVAGLIRSVSEEARRLSHGLNPVALGDDGLMIALQGLAQFTQELLRVRCRFLCASPVLVRDSATAIHLFRIAQEAVNNAVRHARPELIKIALRQDKAGLSLRIADDGCGLPLETTLGRGMGLTLMRHRADLIGAAIRFEPGRPRGTTVICSLPSIPLKQAVAAISAMVRV